MSHSFIVDMNICDGCSKSKRDMIETYWADGNRHYCKRCWPRYRDYYENESGRETWLRVGNRYVPKE